MKLLRASMMPWQVGWVYKTSVFVVAQPTGTKSRPEVNPRNGWKFPCEGNELSVTNRIISQRFIGTWY